MRSRYRAFLIESEYVNLAQRGLNFELKKKELEFRDFYELTAKVSEYEKLMHEENHKRKSIVDSYFQEVEGIGIGSKLWVLGGSIIKPQE